MTTQTKRPRIEVARGSLALVRNASAMGEVPLYYIERAEYDGDGEISGYLVNELRLAGQVNVAVSVPAARVIAVYSPIPNQE